MDWDVFNELVCQMKDVDFTMVQTSGNGEAFLNPNYLDYIRVLRKEFPEKEMWTYNNFSQWTPTRSDTIIKERLFTKVHVRIDSLIPWIFERCGNLNHATVFNNLIYFLEKNTDIPVVILYSNINDYYNRVKHVFGNDKRPSKDYFTDDELFIVPDEEKDLKEYFQKYANVEIDICRMGHSLWGERTNKPLNTTIPCPKFDNIQYITWICPNGDVAVCMYDDTQSTHIAGNIMEEHILDIFYGAKRAEILDNIKHRRITSYPCSNPVACGFPTERIYNTNDKRDI
jgi:MoaA/NifB/PqqE/SkfB family radical SAM enzyme